MIIEKVLVRLKVGLPSPHSCVDSVEDSGTGGSWFEPPAPPIFFPWINDSHCDKINSSLTVVHCFEHGSVGKRSMQSTG